MPETSIVKKIHKWEPFTGRPIGRPKFRWEDDVRNDLNKMKLIKWTEQVQNHLKWKGIVVQDQDSTRVVAPSKKKVTTAWRFLRLRMEERPPIRRIAANILNKQPRTADKGWSYSLWFGLCANNSS